jgi:hypothetical protein
MLAADRAKIIRVLVAGTFGAFLFALWWQSSQFTDFKFAHSASSSNSIPTLSPKRSLDEYIVDRRIRPNTPVSAGALRAWGPRKSIRDNLRLDKQYVLTYVADG